jgi:hypothetical protein
MDSADGRERRIGGGGRVACLPIPLSFSRRGPSAHWKEHDMDQSTRTGRRHLVAQGGAAALAAVALQGALARMATAQDATPAATSTAITAAPGADCAGQEQVEQNLANFDRLDFEGWNAQNWDLFSQLHSDDTHVEGFGTNTDGVEPHVAWSQEFIAANPDTYQILEHPIRIGAGDWTAVTGVLQDGTTMATIARWENGQIAEEYLFSLM